MKNQEHIDNFSSKLTSILIQEIELGNEIVETSKGWSSPDTIIIFLKKPFIGIYEIDNIEYLNLDDPHYWKAEYFDRSKNHSLACRF